MSDRDSIPTHFESAKRVVKSSQGILRGGGDMGALMRATDWSTSPVGPPSSWPQSLRTAVSILLESKFPMYIAWGPQFVQFYNDGYRPILGSTKHPAAMGRSASETFAESWHIIGPMFEGVMQGTAVGSEDWMLPLDRHGYLEECYFTFSYSPIRDESSQVGGVHVTVTETTARVLGERRLRQLRDMATFASQVQGEEEVWQSALDALKDSLFDVPYALLYRAETNALPSLVACSGLSKSSAESADWNWPFEAAWLSRSEEVVPTPPQAHTAMPGGAWPEPSPTALVLPIAGPGMESPFGYLVAGVSARRALDDDYRSFITLVGDQVARAIGNARAFDDAKQRAEALEELNRAKTVFFSNVSHEFRTPLTLMLGPLEDIVERPRAALPEELRSDLELVRRNGLRLNHLVNTLLDFSRLEAGRMQACFRPTDLAALTGDVASQFRAATERANLKLRVDCAPLTEPVYVDADLWEKILLNLLSNALKFTFEGGIEVSLKQRDASAELTVTDSGDGIAATEIPRLFERFHRGPSLRARSHEGSGIGLALVHELVKLHGGTIDAESEQGVGTTFTVTIPLGSAHLPAKYVEASPSASAPSSTKTADLWSWSKEAPPSGPESVPSVDPLAQTKARILVADDNADMRVYLRRVLEPHWSVEVVDNGAQALAAIKSNAPDLVLTDIMMPELDGFGLLQALRKDENTRTIPIVILSARAGEEARIEGLESGADDYLAKPFSARELIARVKIHLELARMRLGAEAARTRLYAVLMQAPVAVSVVTGPEFTFQVANPGYRAMIGGRDIVAKPIREAFPELPDDAPVLEMLRAVRRTGVPFHADEYWVPIDRHGTGTPEDVCFQFTCQPIRNENGVIDEIITIAVDVTSQVLALRESERLLETVQAAETRFRALVEASTETIWAMDSQADMCGEQQQWEAFSGQSQDQYQGLGWTEVIHPDERKAALEELHQAIAQVRPFMRECRLLRADETWRSCYVRVVPVFDPTGQVSEWIGAHTDISDRRALERGVSLLADRLAIAQQAAAIGVYDWSPDKGELYWSQELRELLGVDDTFEPAADEWSKRMTPADSAESRKEFEEAVAEKRLSYVQEYPLRVRNGEVRWVRIAQRHHYDEKGAVQRVVGAVVDIHDLRQGLEGERIARLEAERAAHFSEMFVGILGHDLRNPLSAIMMAAALIETRADAEGIAQPARRITQSAERMERMVEQLLDFTRIRLGKGIPLHHTPVNLETLLSNIIDELSAGEDREIRIRPIGDVNGTWDRDRLAQLFSNLLANACHHGQPGQPIKVTIDGSSPSSVQLAFRNAGAIPAERLASLFEPLGHGVHSNDSHSSGLGLGLYITRQIAEAHGGHIDVRSSEESGTTFELRLPRHPTAETNVFNS